MLKIKQITLLFILHALCLATVSLHFSEIIESEQVVIELSDGTQQETRHSDDEDNDHETVAPLTLDLPKKAGSLKLPSIASFDLPDWEYRNLYRYISSDELLRPPRV